MNHVLASSEDTFFDTDHFGHNVMEQEIQETNILKPVSCHGCSNKGWVSIPGNMNPSLCPICRGNGILILNMETNVIVSPRPILFSEDL